MLGGIGVAVGALDPLEGSLLILPGSALLALGGYLGGTERRVLAWRVGSFVLLLLGVGALWGISMVGGFGGSTGRSNAWGLLILPYFIGWSLAVWGPGAPRWLTWSGLGIGLWYLCLVHMAGGWQHPVTASILTAIGVLTLIGCIGRLRIRPQAKPASAA